VRKLLDIVYSTTQSSRKVIIALGWQKNNSAVVAVEEDVQLVLVEFKFVEKNISRILPDRISRIMDGNCTVRMLYRNVY